MESDIQKAKLVAVSNATARNTKYCARLFTDSIIGHKLMVTALTFYCELQDTKYCTRPFTE